MAGIVIKGTGKSVGDKVVTNDMMAEKVETSDEWIRAKTGIRARNFAENKSSRQMAVEAATSALEKSQIDKGDVSAIIACTFSGDELSPGLASSIALDLGIEGDVITFDLNAGCTGFIYGCKVAEGLLRDNPDKYAIVVGSEKISPWVDMDDRTTCVLFGDGAGAAVVQYTEDSKYTFYGGSKPDRHALYCAHDGKIQMSGQEVYRFAVSTVPGCIKTVMEKANCQVDDIDYFVCHQANERIIDNVANRISSRNDERFYKNLYNYGNTSAASIPIAISDMYDEGRLKDGTKLLCTGFGAGLTYGGMLIEYRGK